MKIKQAEEKLIKAVQNGELQIDTQGRIWRIAIRKGIRGKPQTTYLFKVKKRRAEAITKRGYLMIRIMWGGKMVNGCAHRLVWRYFNGKIPLGMTINHKNGIKTDNQPSNLELATQYQQIIHTFCVLKKGCIFQVGEKNSMTKLTEENVREIRKRRKMGETYASIAKDYQASPDTVSRIVRRIRWGHII